MILKPITNFFPIHIFPESDYLIVFDTCRTTLPLFNSAGQAGILLAYP